MADEHIVLTNRRVYLSIAREAFRKSQDAFKENHKPNSSGTGFINTYDPQQTSFKQALIAEAFAAMYLEALLWSAGCARFGEGRYTKIDGKPYEKRLVHFGITEPAILEAAKRFRECRNELVHEKAGPNDKTIREAQDESAHAIAFIEQVAKLLGPPWADDGHAS